MLELAVTYLIGFALSVILSIIVYQIFIVVRYYEIFKFSLKNNGRLLPLLPFLGNIYVGLFAKGKVNLLSTILWLDEHFGMPLNFWFGHKYHYICNNAKEALIILNHPKCYNKGDLYNDIHWIFRNSILTAPGEIWGPRRRYLRTAFKPSMIKNFYPTFYHQSCLLNKKIESLTPAEDLFKFFNKYAFMNFVLTALGLDIENWNPNIERFGTLVDSAQGEFVKLQMNPFIPGFIWMRTPLGAKLRHLIEEMDSILNIMVMEKKKLCAETSEYVSNPTDVPLIDLLLNEAYKKVAEPSVYEFTLFASAATDTTGHTLAFCFTLLGMHPDEQQRVYEEVIASIGDCIIDNGNIHHLKYTEAVISESLRIFPSVPLYGRWCSENIDLGTKIFPKGANFFVSAYHIHRNPDYWKDPLRFDPTRFLPENASKIIPGSYLPFSLGPRNCIGQHMAMVLLKMTVANVVRAYRITSRHKTLDDFNLESCISMKTNHPLDCNFVPRT